ncbi:hypothetical protein TGGT1_214880 [Toxoplasma gondii GT1]|uniref:Uncharacterized protein n=2 Tax=Toxoplasma gondii TaxID=5811 RepID=S7URA7_TOXGG|nr:hypothetical protein TGGT1_214880 [Toxoplasma gondii GT1]KAF4640047.1 hypothetical protein TGRH88_039720 [Toxoplasma gondii]
MLAREGILQEMVSPGPPKESKFPWNGTPLTGVPRALKSAGRAHGGECSSGENVEMGECSNTSTCYWSSDGSMSLDETQKSDGLEGSRQGDDSPSVLLLERGQPLSSLFSMQDHAENERFPSTFSLATKPSGATVASSAGENFPSVVTPGLRAPGTNSRDVVLGLLNEFLQSLPTANIDEVLKSLEPIRRHAESSRGSFTDSVSEDASKALFSGKGASDKGKYGQKLDAKGGKEQHETGQISFLKGQRSSATSLNTAAALSGGRRRSSVSSASEREGKMHESSDRRIVRKEGNTVKTPPLPSSARRPRRPARGERPPLEGKRAAAAKRSETEAQSGSQQQRLFSFGCQQKDEEEGPRSPPGSVSQRSVAEARKGLVDEKALKNKSESPGQSGNAQVGAYPRETKDRKTEDDQHACNSVNGDGTGRSVSQFTEMRAKELVAKQTEDLREWLGWAGSLGYVPGLYSSAVAGIGDASSLLAAGNHVALAQGNCRPSGLSPGGCRGVSQHVAESPDCGFTLNPSLDLSARSPSSAASSVFFPGKGGFEVSLGSDASQGLQGTYSGSHLKTVAVGGGEKGGPHSHQPPAKGTAGLGPQARGVAPPDPLYIAVGESSSAQGQPSSRTDGEKSDQQVAMPLTQIDEETGEDIDVIALPQKLLPVTPKHLLQTPRPAWLKGTPTAAQAAADCQAASAALRQAAIAELSRTTPRAGQKSEVTEDSHTDRDSQGLRCPSRRQEPEAGKKGNACWSGSALCGIDRSSIAETDQGSELAETARPVSVSAVTLDELFPQRTKSEKHSCTMALWRSLCSSPDVGAVFSRNPAPLVRRRVPDVFMVFDPEQSGTTPLSRLSHRKLPAGVFGPPGHMNYAREPLQFLPDPLHPVAFPSTHSYVPLNNQILMSPEGFGVAPCYPYGGAEADAYMNTASALSQSHKDTMG